jgi:hypothetical protein
VNAVRYIGERAHNFRPASPATPERLQITSEEIRLSLRFDIGDLALLRLAYLLQREAAGIWTSFSGPDAGAGWSLTIDADAARRYRNVAIAYHVLDVQDELRHACGPTSIQDPPLDVETSWEPRW